MKLVHLSDLHFGTESETLVNGLLSAIKVTMPDIVVISGDFTQIGIDSEFRAARDFMAALHAPTFCVPGNHDVPHYNLWLRLTAPYRKYQQYIIPNLCPALESDDVVILGLNSARGVLPHWNWANGMLNAAQRSQMETTLKLDDPRWKICVFHHPIHKVKDMPLDVTVFGATEMLNALHRQKVDLVLTGHVHHASLMPLGDEKHQAVYLSASTALSSRIRGQENGFNVITLLENEMAIDIYKFDGHSFAAREQYRQRRY